MPAPRRTAGPPLHAITQEEAGHERLLLVAGGGSRWKTRMFAPGHGVAEDPATGSAAGPLAVHPVRHGRLAPGEEIHIAQGAEIGRPSTLHARVTASGGAIERVEVGGAAAIVGRGELTAF